MKKVILSIALALSAVGMAFAHGGGSPSGPQGGVIGGIGAGFYSGASGSAKSASQGSATAGSMVQGSGYSFQAAGAVSGGSATIGGNIGIDHATVSTSTTNYAVTGGFGATNQAVHDADGNILNGNQAFANTTNSAKGKAQWGAGAIGGVIAIGSLGDIGGVGNIGGGNGCNGNSCGNHGWGDGSNGNGNGNQGNHHNH